MRLSNPPPGRQRVFWTDCHRNFEEIKDLEVLEARRLAAAAADGRGGGGGQGARRGGDRDVRVTVEAVHG